MRCGVDSRGSCRATPVRTGLVLKEPLHQRAGRHTVLEVVRAIATGILRFHCNAIGRGRRDAVGPQPPWRRASPTAGGCGKAVELLVGLLVLQLLLVLLLLQSLLVLLLRCGQLLLCCSQYRSSRTMRGARCLLLQEQLLFVRRHQHLVELLVVFYALEHGRVLAELGQIRDGGQPVRHLARIELATAAAGCRARASRRGVVGTARRRASGRHRSGLRGTLDAANAAAELTGASAVAAGVCEAPVGGPRRR